MKKTTYPEEFSGWTTQMIENAFGLKRVKAHNELVNWLNGKAELSDFEKNQLDFIHKHTEERILQMSEADIKLKLIGPMLLFSGLDTDKYGTFAEVKLDVYLKDKKSEQLRLKGRPDLIIATGKYEPILPYFCLHEYKKQLGADSEPQGQLLAAMLAARQMNLNMEVEVSVVYGSYTIGKEWIFVILCNNEYSISKTYLLDEITPLCDVLAILKGLKPLIEKYLVD